MGARAAAEEAAAERQAVLQQNQSPAGDRAVPGAGSDRDSGDRPGAGRRGGSNGGGIPGPGAYGGKPAWKSYPKMKNLGRQAEATLEMMYSRTQVRCGTVQYTHGTDTYRAAAAPKANGNQVTEPFVRIGLYSNLPS